jgi:acyl dehydratase
MVERIEFQGRRYASEWPQFSDLSIGDEVVSGAYGAVDIIDVVRWAGFQENYAQLHYDREYVRTEAGLPKFIASGAFRESLMVRLLTDWMGPAGRLAKMKTRQTYSTFEGDSLKFVGRITEKSDDANDPWVVCEMEGFNGEDRQILQTTCTLRFDPVGRAQ